LWILGSAIWLGFILFRWHRRLFFQGVMAEDMFGERWSYMWARWWPCFRCGVQPYADPSSPNAADNPSTELYLARLIDMSMEFLAPVIGTALLFLCLRWVIRGFVGPKIQRTP
jgi:hypothetical protein